MDYKLLVLDVDGTLLNSRHEISKRTLSTLIKIQQSGIRIALASGRPPHGLEDIASQLELANYGGFIIAYNGSKIIDAQSGERIFERTVNPELIPYLEKKSRKNKFSIFTYHDNYIVTDSPDNPHIQAEASLNNLQIVHEPEFSTAIDFMPSKIVLVSDDEPSLVALADLWKRRLNGTLESHRSEDYFLEVLPYGVDKSGALSVLLEYLQMDASKVVAFGDGIRDVGVIQMAGMGVAMGNARESVKACADQVTLSNDEDGVAVAIEQAILSEMLSSNKSIEEFNRNTATSLMGNLGIVYTFASPNRVEATMPVDHRTRQPFGILHGGATLALAETVAGLGSILRARPEETVVGMEINGNHISSAHEGDTVRAVATIIHAGRSSHLWNVDVFTSTGKLVSSIRVLNSVLKRK